MNDFNRIAWIYDALARWIFFGNILKSQNHFLPLIQPMSRVLIIGGGSGQGLEAMDKLEVPLTIDFIEPSSLMIEKAKRRAKKLANLDVQFYQTRFQSFESNQEYNWVCCFYFLDLFKLQNLNQHLNYIKKFMDNQAYLVVADFQNSQGKFWKKVLSVIMHGFFKVTTGLESHRLNDINGAILGQGFQKFKEAYFFGQFIFSAIYQKEVYKNGNHS